MSNLSNSSNYIVLAFVACVVITLIVCAFLRTRTELFSNASHYCVESIGADNRPVGVPIVHMNRHRAKTMRVDEAQHKCDNHHKCRFFTCDNATDVDKCDSATFYKDSYNSLVLNETVPEKASKVFRKSVGPCHNYCFEYAKPTQKGRPIKGPVTHATIDRAKKTCDLEAECDFFTCKNGTECDDMQMYSNSGENTEKHSVFTDINEESNTCPKEFPFPYNKDGDIGGHCCINDNITTSGVDGRTSDVCNGGQNPLDSRPCRALGGGKCFPPKKDMHIKTKQACATTVNAIPTRKKATQQAYLLPYAYNVHGGMKKYSSGIRGMVSSPDEVQQRTCNIDHSRDSEGDHDSDCFLHGRNAMDTADFDFLDLFNFGTWWSEDEKYKYYKDKNHNVYQHKTNMCCANDVAHAERQAAPHSQKVDLPKAHPCNNLKNTVFSTDCDRFCDEGKVYRGDLKACVPVNKKCHYENSLTCDHNSPYRDSFTRACTYNNRVACAPHTCQKNEVGMNYQSCKEGKPYYKFVGSYDETVLLFKKLGELYRGMHQDDKTYYIMNSETNEETGTITDVLTMNQYYFGKLPQIKITTKEGIHTTYNVLSLSLELQYIELYKENTPLSESKTYVILEKNGRAQ